MNGGGAVGAGRVSCEVCIASCAQCTRAWYARLERGAWAIEGQVRRRKGRGMERGWRKWGWGVGGRAKWRGRAMCEHCALLRAHCMQSKSGARGYAHGREGGWSADGRSGEGVGGGVGESGKVEHARC
jgi:hypothetical protein